MRIAQAVPQFCATRSVIGVGVDRRAYTAPSDGFISVRTAGPAGSDWDVAVVDRSTGRVLNGAAGVGASEIVTAIVRSGQELAVQTCRRTGVDAVDVTVRFISADFSAAQTGYALKLVRVPVKTAAERENLRSLGFDTTDHAAPEHQDLFLSSQEDENKLTNAGFAFSVQIADVAARDRENRLVEQRAKRSTRRARARPPTCRAAGRPTGRFPTSKRSSSSSRWTTRPSCGSSRCRCRRSRAAASMASRSPRT